MNNLGENSESKNKYKHLEGIDKSFIEKIEKDNIEFLDFYFTNVSGKFHCMTFSVDKLEKKSFEEGMPFDGSSIEGFKTIDKSDMILKPDLSTYFKEINSKHSSGAVICDIIEPENGETYNRDARSTLKKAQEYLKNSEIGDTSNIGTEPEFFIFDGNVTEIEQGNIENSQFLGHKTNQKKNYFQPGYLDPHKDIRSDMIKAMNEVGIEATLHHSEVGVNQNEIGTKYNNALTTADNVQKYKYIVHSIIQKTNIEQKTNKVATFMPKPLSGDNGSGMHIHQSISKDGKNIFAGKEYAELSQEALWYIGGIIKHAKAINAFSNPTINSYKRLLPGFEAPSHLAYSAKNRSAAIRIPHSEGEQAKRIEVRFPDPSANPYLTIAAMIMAGLDGIKNKIDPGKARDTDLENLPEEEAKKIPVTSKTLQEALDALSKDRNFLTKGGVFDNDQIDAYIKLKEEELKEFTSHISRAEIKKYFSV